MENQKRGFTLIELLVVVLIIGILAAVAVPQYQVAVEKSRLTEALVNGQKIVEAQMLRQLSTGEWDGVNKDLLDIELSGGEWDEYGEWYATPNFLYWIGDGDHVGAFRQIAGCSSADADACLYLVDFWADGSRICNDLGSTLGRKICTLLVAQGFKYTPSDDDE